MRRRVWPRGVRGRATPLSARSAFASPPFRWFCYAAVAINTAQLVQVTAATWVVHRDTGSVLWSGLVSAASISPLMFFALAAGALADGTLGRRVAVLRGALIMTLGAAAMASMGFAGWGKPGLLLAALTGTGVGVALLTPAWQATIPDLVATSSLRSAVALNSVTVSVAWAIGPAAAGALLSAVPPEWVYASATSGYVLALFLLYRINWPEAETGDALEVRSPPPELDLSAVSVTLALGLSIGALRALVPAVVAERFDASALTYGLLFAAIGLGAALAGLGLKGGGKELQGGRLGTALGGFGLLVAGLGATRDPIVAGVVLCASGVCWTAALADVNSAMQLNAPSSGRSGVMAVFSMALYGGSAVGSVLSGAVGSQVGAGYALALSSAPCVCVGAVMLAKEDAVKEAARAALRPRRRPGQPKE